MNEAYNIREQIKAYRKTLSDAEVLKLSSQIESMLYEEIHKQERMDILCFYPLETEVNLFALYEKLLKEGYRLYFPKTYPEEILFYRIDSMRDFKIGAFQIMEPYSTTDRFLFRNEPCLCIVPGLAFSKDGHRIGYGGGYYDRFLKRKDIFKIGVCFEKQIIEFKPQGYDVDMDAVITDQNIYKN